MYAAMRPAFSLSSTIYNSALYKSVLQTWFASQPADRSAPTEDSNKLWWYNPDKDAAAAFDEQLHKHFLPALAPLYPAELKLPAAPDSWEKEVAQGAELAKPFLSTISHPSETLGVILLLDQISRNTLRAKSEQGIIYGQLDRLARAVTRAALEDKLDVQETSYARRQWFYLPLMHSEWLQDHEIFSQKMTAAKNDTSCTTSKECHDAIENTEKFEEKHVGILKQFGRYPHRNEALGREPTAAEKRYMDDGGETFTA